MKYGKLTILETLSSQKGHRRVLTLCECGEKSIKFLSNLKSGHTANCGCGKKQKTAQVGKKNERHGDSKSYLYRTWVNMKRRCNDPSFNMKHNYMKREIKVCEEWSKSYKKFKRYVLNELGERPKGYSLDRIDNDGNYEPGNIRWASSKTQSRNTSKYKIPVDMYSVIKEKRNSGYSVKQIATEHAVSTSKIYEILRT